MIRLNDAELRTITAYIGEKYGIELGQKRTLVETRLAKLLKQYDFPTFTHLLNALQGGHYRALEDDVVDLVSTHYTFFMRESYQFELMVNRILPAIPATQMLSGLRFWSAGCSTGQECYTLLMFLEEYRRAGGKLGEYTLRATDISEHSLEKARKGQYSADSLSDLPTAWLQQYWQKSGDASYTIAPALRQKVSFEWGNILAPEASYVGRFDIIFCKNALIYFNNESKAVALNNLYQALRPGGHLLLGHSETILNKQSQFKYIGPSAYAKV